MIVASACLFVAVQIMFEYRSVEKRLSTFVECMADFKSIHCLVRRKEEEV